MRADEIAEEDFEVDYVDESHMQAFARALASDDLIEAESPLSTPVADRDGRISHHERIRKVSAVSDFAPISTKVKRRTRKEDKAPGKASEWSYNLFRWPLLFLILSFISAEFGLYVLTRQVVNLFEYLLAWRGRKRFLRNKLRSARSYDEWKQYAATLDEYLGFNEWKKIEQDPFYDWQLIKKVRRSLRSLKDKDDMRGLIGVLEICLRPNFAGTENPRLYSETFYGTKASLEAYVQEVESCLAALRNTAQLSIEEKRKFFRDVNRNLGSSALCLSGGATFGYYSFGVVKAFLDANLLPRVIAGTSAGGLVAAMACTRTDEELKRLLVPRLADRITACEEPFRIWFRRFRKTGARFDTVQWARKACFFTRGSLTFREAYERTGRALNVSVIPFDQHSPTKLLNYMTAPDCVIWSAIIASAAVPGILNPVVLMHKTKDGSVVPWNWGSKFKDGSLRVDIPLQSLNLLFNVNHPIVSQVNPHVHMFFFAPRGSPGRPVAHRRGKGWRGGFFLSAAEQYLKLELTKNFKVIRDLELLPQILGQDWSGVFLQRFDGSVTIWPKTRFMDWINILTDPDQTELGRKMRVGEMVTWPKLHMIENRYRLEREIMRGRLAVRQRTVAREPHPAVKGDEPRPVPTFTLDSASPDSGTARGSSRRRQLSIDSDAEKGFQAGGGGLSRRFNRVADGTKSISSYQSLPDPLWVKPDAMTDVRDATRYRKSGHAHPSRPPTGRSSGRSKEESYPSSPDSSSSVSDEKRNGSIRRSGQTSPSKSPSFLARPSNFLSNLRTPFATSFSLRVPRSPTGNPKTQEEPVDEHWESGSSSDDETDIAWLQARATRMSPVLDRNTTLGRGNSGGKLDGEGMDGDFDES